MNHIPLLSLLLVLVCFSACEEDQPELTVPLQYTFQPSDYSGQTDRLNMLSALSAYAKQGAEGEMLSADLMRDMFSNTSAPFEDGALNLSTRQLENKTFELDREYIRSLFDDLELASNSMVAGANGQAGIVSSGTKSYLFDANGMEPAQLIEKGIMGACFYYQITAVYLADEKQSADNTISDPVQGTALEHHWDEAFGYTSFPVDFTSGYMADGIQFWAKYCNERDMMLQCNRVLMDAFKLGRAAISANQLDIRNAQIDIITETLEEVAAATAIHYLNQAIGNISDHALRNHELSEALAFVKALKYNPARRINLEEIQAIEELIGDNLYEVALADITSARSMLASIYDFQTIETSL